MDGGSDLFSAASISHMLTVVILDLCTLLCIVLINAQSLLEMVFMCIETGGGRTCTRSNYTFDLEE